MNAFFSRQLDDYWFETGTPSYLVDLQKNFNYDLRTLQEGDEDGDVLNSLDSATYDPIPVIYQSGYLTIKGYDPEFKTFRLGFPNKEVEQAFMKCLLPWYTPDREKKSYSYVGNFIRDLSQGNVDQFMKRFQTFFAGADYRVVGEMEKYFQNAMFIIFRLMGCLTQVEYVASDGRADTVVSTPDYIYIIEIKLDGVAQEALRQIDAYAYAVPPAMDRRKLYKVGVNSSSETRGVEQWEVEPKM